MVLPILCRLRTIGWAPNTVWTRPKWSFGGLEFAFLGICFPHPKRTRVQQSTLTITITTQVVVAWQTRCTQGLASLRRGHIVRLSNVITRHSVARNETLEFIAICTVLRSIERPITLPALGVTCSRILPAESPTDIANGIERIQICFVLCQHLFQSSSCRLVTWFKSKVPRLGGVRSDVEKEN